MKKNIILALVALGIGVMSPQYVHAYSTAITYGKYKKATVESLIATEKKKKDIGTKIADISKKFLGVPYKENTLSPAGKEKLIIAFDVFDCFTYLDTVEALRLSTSFSDFTKKFISIRYKNGVVGYLTRNHFFTDWVDSPKRIQDVTIAVSNGAALSVEKNLNQKSDGTYFIQGLDAKKRTVNYIPPEKIDVAVVASLKTGDYIGMYSPIEGLDVSHTGIFIKNSSGTFLRHASSKKGIRKVIDVPFLEYVTKTKGIVVLRPL